MRSWHNSAKAAKHGRRGQRMAHISRHRETTEEFLSRWFAEWQRTELPGTASFDAVPSGSEPDTNDREEKS